MGVKYNLMMAQAIKGLLLAVFICFANAISVGFITIPNHGHTGAMNTLLNEVAKRGHKTVVFSAEQASHKFPNAYKFYSLGNETTSEITQNALGSDKDDISILDVPLIFAEIERIVLTALLPLFKELSDKNELPDVLIIDFLTFGGFDIADLYDIPAVVSLPGMYPSKYKPNWMPGNDDGLSLTRRLKGQATKTIENILQYSFYYLSNQLRGKLGLEPWKHFDSCLSSDKITFQFSFPPLVEPGPGLIGPVQLVGLPFKPREDVTLTDQKVISWINKQTKPIIYVSFGTISRQPAEQLEFLFAQFKKCQRFSFIWSLRDEVAERSSIVLDGLREENTPDHILRVPWVDQVALLEHVDIFFTHAGYNSLVEAIYTKTLMVCMPFMAEQPENCQRLEFIGAAKQVDRLDLNVDLCEVFGDVFDDSSYKETVTMLSQYAKVASNDGLSDAVDTLELIAEFGEAPLLPLDYSAPFYVRTDLDILALELLLAFILGVFVTRCCCARKIRTGKKLKAE